MHLSHRGLTIDLPDDDPRVVIIEAVLFGRTLPPPMQVTVAEDQPAPQPSTPQPSTPQAAPVEATAAQRAFWHALTDLQRRDLLILTERAYRPDELEKALGVSGKALVGMHSSIVRYAHSHGIPSPLSTKARNRKYRRHTVRPDDVAWIKALATR